MQTGIIKTESTDFVKTNNFILKLTTLLDKPAQLLVNANISTANQMAAV